MELARIRSSERSSQNDTWSRETFLPNTTLRSSRSFELREKVRKPHAEAHLVQQLRVPHRDGNVELPQIARRRRDTGHREDGIRGAPRSLVRTLHRREIRVRMYVIRRQEEIPDFRVRLGPRTQ